MPSKIYLSVLSLMVSTFVFAKGPIIRGTFEGAFQYEGNNVPLKLKFTVVNLGGSITRIEECSVFEVCKTKPSTAYCSGSNTEQCSYLRDIGFTKIDYIAQPGSQYAWRTDFAYLNRLGFITPLFQLYSDQAGQNGPDEIRVVSPYPKFDIVMKRVN